MRILSILFLVIIILPGCRPKAPAFDLTIYDCDTKTTNTHPASNAFQAFLEQKVKEGLPGISMLIETPKGIWVGAAGVSEIPLQTPMKPCNIHKLGSSTKVFTATLIFQLYEQGLLHFEDPMANHLPKELIDQVANYQQVTVKQLLTHTSGIPDYLDIAYTLNYYDDLSRIWTEEEELSMVYGEEAEFSPGAKVNYCNTNYLLLGMIAKQITGKSGAALFQQEIFQPLSMTHTYFDEEGESPVGLVRGYYDENGNGNFIDITYRGFARNAMAGGVSSTVEDMYQFTTAMWKSTTLLSDSTKYLITTLDPIPFVSPEKFEYGDTYKVKRVKGIGLCWFQYDTDHGICYGHDGGYDGRRSVMRYFPDSQSTIIYLVNGSGESIKPLLKEMRRNDLVSLLEY